MAKRGRPKKGIAMNGNSAMDSNAQSITNRRPNTSTVVNATPKRVSQTVWRRVSQVLADSFTDSLTDSLTETPEQSLLTEDNASALESSGIFENMPQLTRENRVRRERVNGVTSGVTDEEVDEDVDDVSIGVDANASAHQPNHSPLYTPADTCAQYLRGAEELSRRFFGTNQTADQLMALLKYSLVSYCLGNVDMALQKIVDAKQEIGLAALHTVQYPIPVNAVGRESGHSLGRTSRALNVVPYNPALHFGANNRRQRN